MRGEVVDEDGDEGRMCRTSQLAVEAMMFVEEEVRRCSKWCKLSSGDGGFG